jgi:triosephosphate isomerase
MENKMRKKVVAGNWKMNKTLDEAVQLVSELKNELARFEPKCEIIVCPPFTNLEAVHAVIKDSPIHLGAQNMYFEDSGAFTGEISPDMLRSVGVEYVIIGHSERRAIFNEDDSTINKKLKKAFEKELKPILCVGETLEQRESGITEQVIRTQIEGALQDITAENISDLILAYEPVWAIGTGKTATPDQAEEIHMFIRNLIATLYDATTAENLTIQYGGSVKPTNAASLLSQPNIDGALVGGACLKAESFVEIIKSA